MGWARLLPGGSGLGGHGNLQRLFDEVHAFSARLNGINRAFVVFLSKRDDIPSPSAFGPVLLQNRDVKVLCRGLTSRL